MLFKNRVVLIVVILTLMLSGCYKQPLTPSAALTPLSSDKLIDWGIPDKLTTVGEGNSYRVVGGIQGEFLELATSNQGQMEYYVEETADNVVNGQFKLQFLSTEGTGNIKISALDENNHPIATIGFIVTGKIPENSNVSKWSDIGWHVNYKGDWLTENYDITQLIKNSFPNFDVASAYKYRLSVEVGQGQHVLINKFNLSKDLTKAIKLFPVRLQYSLQQGDNFVVETNVVNTSKQPIAGTMIKLIEPYGYGLVAQSEIKQIIDELQPGEIKHLSWQLKAQRPDAANLNMPWQLKFSINDVEVPASISVAIADNRPGKVFYVMTEDLEPIDSAGYPKAWGNGNGWLDPQEFLVQMVNKAEKLNAIAEKHGAKWTHYIAWPAVAAAEWAGTQSTSGEWQKVVANIKQSVKLQSEHGHEYGIHMHSDYDPNLPGNVLSYNSDVDGLWANHLRHGWAHSINSDGGFSDYATRTGILYKYLSILAELSADSAQGQPLTARAGSFDFGNGSESEAMSTEAYKKVGLWGSTDADGNIGGLTAGAYGQEIYFAKPDDINTPANELTQLGIVEFRPTPRQWIGYDGQNAASMNAKADEGMQYFTVGNAIKPGIHGIVGFTHAMFIMGEQGWQSTEGGQFQALDEHLAYLKAKYADAGLLEFGTGAQMVRAYLDYYTPNLIGLYGKRLSDKWGIAEYTIDILGQDIPVDEKHVHNVSVKYPLYLRDSAYKISVFKNNQLIYTTWGLPTPYNDINFVVDDKNAEYTLKVYHNNFIYKLVNIARKIRGIL